jgi:hypothetical protein
VFKSQILVIQRHIFCRCYCAIASYAGQITFTATLDPEASPTRTSRLASLLLTSLDSWQLEPDPGRLSRLFCSEFAALHREVHPVGPIRTLASHAAPVKPRGSQAATSRPALKHPPALPQPT